MPYKTKYGTHYHMTEGCCGATEPCGSTDGLSPCSRCCDTGQGGADSSGIGGMPLGGNPSGSSDGAYEATSETSGQDQRDDTKSYLDGAAEMARSGTDGNAPLPDVTGDDVAKWVGDEKPEDTPYPIDDDTRALIDGLPPASREFAEAAAAAGFKTYAKRGEVAVDIPKEAAAEDAEMTGSITVYGDGRSGWYGYWFPDWPNTVSQRGFNLRPDKGLSIESVIDSARTCDRCGKVVPFSQIQRYSFAGGGCPDCIDALRDEYEYPGWYN